MKMELPVLNSDCGSLHCLLLYYRQKRQQIMHFTIARSERRTSSTYSHHLFCRWSYCDNMHVRLHENCSGHQKTVKTQVAQAHYERSAYINLFFFAYIMSRQNIRVCMEKTCDQALFSFRLVKHSGGTVETKNRA